MKSANLSMTAQPKQVEALKMLKYFPVVLYGGAKGGGKSWLVRAWQLARRLKYPRTSGVIIRKTYNELIANHVKKYWEEYPQLKQYYKKDEKVLELPNGSNLYFRYLDNTDDVYNYQGLEFEDIALDECTQHSEEVFKVLWSSNRTANKAIIPRFLLTGNPGGVGNQWTKRLFIDRQFNKFEIPDDFAFVSASIYDNERMMDADPKYIERLMALPEDKRKAYLEGDWNVFEGMAFSEWRGDKHVVKPRYKLTEIPSNWDVRLGWDDGQLRPRAVVLMVQTNDGDTEVVWEYYKTGETVSVAAKNIKDELMKLGIYERLRDRGKVIYDPSMDIHNAQTGKPSSQIVKNILEISMQAANNNRVEGFRRMKEFMYWEEGSQPSLRFWDNCYECITSIQSLVYEGNGIDDIDSDGNDHGYDAIRYALMSYNKLPLNLRRLEKPKDEDLTPKWWREYMDKRVKHKVSNPLDTLCGM